MRRLLLALLVFGLCQERALASPPAPAEGDPNTPAASGSDDAEGAHQAAAPTAHQLVSEAKERYRAGDLRGSLQVLEQCFALTDDAKLLFNIAQVYRELGECESALRNYELYVRKAPEGKRVPDAKKYAAELEPKCGAGAVRDTPAASSNAAAVAVKAPAPPAPSEPVASTSHSPTPPSSAWPLIAGVSFTAAALAAGATGYFALATHNAKDDVEREMDKPTINARYAIDRLDDFYRNREWAIGMGITLGVTAGVGTYALVRALRVKNDAAQNLTLSVTPAGTSVGYQWRF